MGALLGPFWLNRPLAAGGMGEVWAGVHREQGVQVAIKFLTRDANDPDFRAAFDAEVAAMASLDHPNVVRIYDYGEVGTHASENLRQRVKMGTPYIVMEQARGTLSDRAEALPWETVHTALQHLLAALAHAHARGLLHRDLKPGNVLLCPGEREGEADRVVLTDFGFAGRAGDRASVVVGMTPSYAAPEQLRWDSRREGPWTDLFALGSLAWRLLTGVAPYQADTVEQAIANQAKGLTPLKAEVPDGVRDWLARAMAPKPMARFPSAADALSALDDAVNGRRMTLAGIPRSSRDRSLRRLTIHLSGTGLGLIGMRHQSLVGREKERAQLWAWLRECARGRSRVVVLRGPEGVGTSHLARWLETRAHERGGLLALWATHSERPTSEDGVAGLLRRALHVDGLGPTELEAAIAKRLLDYGADPADAHAHAVVLTGGGRRYDRVRRFLQLFTMLGRGRVLVVVLDDATFDADSLEFARAAADDHERRLMVVVTASVGSMRERPELVAELDRLVAHPEVRELPLQPLSEAERSQLLRQVLLLDDAVAGRAAQLSAGNPAVMMSMLSGWIDAGILETGVDGFWHLAPGAEIQLPDDVLHPWLERVERALVGWDDAAGQALEMAAVLGLRVSEGWWAAACRPIGVEVPEGLVTHLSARGLTRPDPQRGDPGWAFTDGRVQAALLRRAERHGRRQHMHSVVADLLPPSEPSRAPHLLQSGRVSEALLPLYTGLMARLRDRPASFGAHCLGDLEAAVQSLSLPASDPRIGWVLRGRAALELARGDLAAADKATEDLLRGARSYGWAKAESRALRMQAAAARRRLALGRAVSLATQALQTAKTPRDEAEAFRELAAAERMRGRMKAASTYVKEGRARCEDLPGLEGWLWLEVAMIGLAVARSKDAVRALTRARSAFAKAGDRAGYCAVSEGHGWAALEDGELRVADQRLTSAQQAWMDVGQRRAAVRTLLRRGLVAAEAGQLELALQQFRDVAGAVGAVGDRRLEIIARMGVAATSLALGDSRAGAGPMLLLNRDAEEARLVDPDVARLLRLAAPWAPELVEPASSQLRRLGRAKEAEGLGAAE